MGSLARSSLSKIYTNHSIVAWDNTVVGTAIPAITNHFGTLSDVGWYSVAYRLTLCAFQFMFGKLCQLFSIKHVFMVAVAIMQVGSLLCATATSSPMFVVGRAVAGLGAAGMLSACFNLSLYLVPLRKRSFYSSMLAAIESVSEMATSILGGVLTQTLDWRWCFYITLSVGGITLAIMALFFRPPKRARVLPGT